MELTKEESDAQILIENTEGIVWLDEQVQALIAQFESADDEKLAELKKEIWAIEPLRSAYRRGLYQYKNKSPLK